MKLKAAFVLIAAVVAGASGFVWRGAQHHETSAIQPELRWLQREFELNATTMQRITELHRGYSAECGKMCAALRTSDEEVSRLLIANRRTTPELKDALARSSELTGQCQRRMVEHFYAVAKEMPPEAAQHYLELMTPVVTRPQHGWMKMEPH